MNDRTPRDFTRIAPPNYKTLSPNTAESVQPFTLIDAQIVRQSGKGTSRAWELTFRAPAPLCDGRVVPGMQVGLFPVNDEAKVHAVLRHLRHVPRGRVPHIIPPFGRISSQQENLLPEQILAHCCDLTHPTDALLEAVHIPQPLRAAYAQLPIEQFVQQPGVWVDFKTLVHCQPELKNRKYTPSRIDRERGEFSILLAEVEKEININGIPSQSPGPMTRMLVHAAEHLTTGTKKPLVVQGFLDLRKHKLSYSLFAGPKILVGTGVGIAPHLAYLRDCAAKGRDPNVALMLCGARHPIDTILAEEIAGYLPKRKTGLFSTFNPLVPVYSNGHSGKREYVGDVLKKHSDLVWNSLNHTRFGGLYLCGWETMLPAIESSLRTIAEQHGTEGDAWLRQLYANGQIQKSLSGSDRFYRDFVEEQKSRELSRTR